MIQTVLDEEKRGTRRKEWQGELKNWKVAKKWKMKESLKNASLASLGLVLHLSTPYHYGQNWKSRLYLHLFRKVSFRYPFRNKPIRYGNSFHEFVLHLARQTFNSNFLCHKWVWNVYDIFRETSPTNQSRQILKISNSCVFCSIWIKFGMEANNGTKTI